MYKIFINSLLIIFLCFTLSCNTNDYYPVNVFFKDGTLPNSDKSSITAIYLEDKRIREKYTDILISSNIDNLEFSIAKENDKYIDIKIAEKEIWYSLTELLKDKIDIEYTTFAKAQTTTYVIKSETPTVLQFKAVGGNYNNDELENIFTVSKTFELKIQ
ncbi:MAG: hypothetical protein PHV79_01475 [Clostridia bacterium]|jgi:hypothetical protein|nr:hypothetical protein [Clostridia bacterium]